MDISDISKVASRKRLTADAEKLREKVSRESAKIIKLKVAQDTAYWDLKEKLQQVEGNHERLQQNMVEVQMQHEAISGQYQEELRRRPETLNKMSGTRDICDVLEEYSERLKETLSRCKSDQGALCAAYSRAGRLTRDLALQQARRDLAARDSIERLRDTMKLSNEHQSQLVQYLTTAKQQLDAEVSEVRSQLSAASAQRDELRAAAADLRARADNLQLLLQKKEESILSLQNDMKQLLQEFNQQANEMKNTMIKQDKEYKEALEENEALKKAVRNQEEFTKSVCAQNDQLNDKISGLEQQQDAAVASLRDLEGKLQMASGEIDVLKNDNEILKKHNENLEIIIGTKNELVANAEVEIQNMNERLTTLDAEKVMMMGELTAAKEERDLNMTRVEELLAAKGELEIKVAHLEADVTKLGETSSQTINELTNCINEKDKELNDRAHTISQLMTDVKNASDARTKVDITLQRVRKEAETEREAAKEKDKKMAKQIEQLEITVRDKDDELSKQMSIILEIRQEKERLNSKIESMQNKIDNIQKELTGPPRAAPPDLDDNALMCPPSARARAAQNMPQRDEARQLDSMLFSMFSDTSMDGDTLDAGEVNRRFEALSRGERMSPVPLKRRAGTAAHAGLKYKLQEKEDCDISLSQVKNDLKNKEKGFFKNKRIENKARKLK